MSGRHDHAERRRGQRKGRETGCSVYIPGEQLQRLRVAPTADGGPPYYRTWAGPRDTIIVRFYPAK